MNLSPFPSSLSDLPDQLRPFVWLNANGDIVSQHATGELAMQDSPQSSGEFFLLKYHETGANTAGYKKTPAKD